MTIDGSTLTAPDKGEFPRYTPEGMPVIQPETVALIDNLRLQKIEEWDAFFDRILKDFLGTGYVETRQNKKDAVKFVRNIQLYQQLLAIHEATTPKPYHGSVIAWMQSILPILALQEHLNACGKDHPPFDPNEQEFSRWGGWLHERGWLHDTVPTVSMELIPLAVGSPIRDIEEPKDWYEFIQDFRIDSLSLEGLLAQENPELDRLTAQRVAGIGFAEEPTAQSCRFVIRYLYYALRQSRAFEPKQRARLR